MFNNMNKGILSNLIHTYDISKKNAKMLTTLRGFKIALILDDSSSMKNVEANKKISRWDELKNFAKTVIEIAAAFNTNGCDVHFLNNTRAKHVRSFGQLEAFFKSGKRFKENSSQIAKTLQKVINDYPPELLRSKNLLIILVTSGEQSIESGMRKLSILF